MKLFELHEWQLQVSPEAWGLLPFKKLLNKDKTEDKEIALKEMLFIWFLCDIKSDYQYIINYDARVEEIKKDLGLPKRWKIHKDLQAAIDFFVERSTTTSKKLLEDSKYIADKLSTRLKQFVDEDELNIQSLSRVTSALKQMPEIVLAIQKTEGAVLKEQAEKSSSVGSQEKALFEDGLQFDE